jgi:hypothetical protein
MTERQIDEETEMERPRGGNEEMEQPIDLETERWRNRKS